MGKRPAILADTNIILEAKRVGAMTRLCAHGVVVTVQLCAVEAMSGVPGSPGRIPVIEEDLRALETMSVTDAERAALLLATDGAAGLHDGERDLVAHAMARTDAFVIVTADQAAVRVAIEAGLGDRVVSLETVLNQAGITPDKELKTHYTRRKLDAWKATHTPAT